MTFIQYENSIHLGGVIYTQTSSKVGFNAQPPLESGMSAYLLLVDCPTKSRFILRELTDHKAGGLVMGEKFYCLVL